MHGPLTPEEMGRLRRLPRVSRAREHRLYMTDGSRWTDLWADGGRALLGHRPAGVTQRIKNELERGLYAPYPGVWEGRLERQLLQLFPGYSRVCFFASAAHALASLPDGVVPVDPLDLPADNSEVSDGKAFARLKGAVWGRPLLPEHPVADICLPILPVSGIGEVQPVLLTTGREGSGIDSKLLEWYEGALVSELVSPVLLAALTRVCLTLAGMKNNAGEAGKTEIPLTYADTWEKKGPYLLFRGDEAQYRKHFERMFSRRVLIAPGLGRPSVFPASVSENELKLLCSGEG